MSYVKRNQLLRLQRGNIEKTDNYKNYIKQLNYWNFKKSERNEDIDPLFY